MTFTHVSLPPIPSADPQDGPSKKIEWLPPKDTITLAELVQVQRQISSAELSLPEVLTLVATTALRASGAAGAMVALTEGDCLVVHACAGPLAGPLGAMLPLQNPHTWPHRAVQRHPGRRLEPDLG